MTPGNDCNAKENKILSLSLSAGDKIIFSCILVLIHCFFTDPEQFFMGNSLKSRCGLNLLRRSSQIASCQPLCSFLIWQKQFSSNCSPNIILNLLIENDTCLKHTSSKMAQIITDWDSHFKTLRNETKLFVSYGIRAKARNACGSTVLNFWANFRFHFYIS